MCLLGFCVGYLRVVTPCPLEGKGPFIDGRWKVNWEIYIYGQPCSCRVLVEKLILRGLSRESFLAEDVFPSFAETSELNSLLCQSEEAIYVSMEEYLRHSSKAYQTSNNGYLNDQT